MKTLFDTSVLVAAMIESHPAHPRALSWLQQARYSRSMQKISVEFIRSFQIKLLLFELVLSSAFHFNSPSVMQGLLICDGFRIYMQSLSVTSAFPSRGLGTRNEKI